MKTKRCSHCRKKKALSFYGKNASTKDGFSYWCNECRAEYRQRPRVKTLHNALNRKYRTNPETKKKKNEYVKKTRTKEVNRTRERYHGKRYRALYPEKDRAKRAVRRAIEAGVLMRPEECPKCGAPDPKRSDGRSGIHAHHPNGYDNPLDVQWLCVHCHTKEHPPRARGKDDGAV